MWWIILLISVGIVAIGLVIRYIIHYVLTKAENAVEDVIVKKRQEKSSESENLADRFKK